jgi:transcription initiation factor IIF auxiliary subunit
MVSHIF